jgi:DNA-binding MarR family transcriptional regulator
MKYMSKQLESIFQISRTFSIMSRRFDAGLGGISLNECIILSSLLQAPENKMRRIDLAEKIGFTPSGITRLLLPMEKIGLVLREKNEHDARVSYVILAPG